MKCLVYYGKEDIRYEGVDDPMIVDDRDIIVETKACGICGSDLHVFHADISEIGEGLELPERFCVGHEAVGEVVATGKSVASHKIGDLVMLSGFVSCGYCRACVRGNSKKCENGGRNVYGFGTGLGGCQSELVRVPAGTITRPGSRTA